MNQRENQQKLARDYTWQQESQNQDNLSPLSLCSSLLQSDLTQEESSGVDALLAGSSPDLTRAVHSFWMKVIQQHSFGYTLFAGKPIASAEFLDRDTNPENTSSADEQHNKENFPSVFELSAWRQLESQVATTNFHMTECPATEKGTRVLTLVNLTAVSTAFALHQSIFQEEFGPEFLANDLFMALQRPARPLDMLNNRADLCGILYGFDAASSVLYNRVNELQQESKRLIGGIRRIARPDAQPSAHYLTAQEELDDLYSRVDFRNSEFSPPTDTVVRDIPFLGLKNSQKVTALREEYAELQQLLSDLVKDQDTFLHKVLTQYFFRLA